MSKSKVTLVSAKVKPCGLSYLFHVNSTDLSQLVRLNFGLLRPKFWSKTFAERIAKLDLAIRSAKSLYFLT